MRRPKIAMDSVVTAECDPQPNGRGRSLHIAGEVGQLLKLCGQHRALGDPLLADTGRAARRTRQTEALATARRLATHDLALADEARGELRGATVLARRATQNQGVAAILHQRLCL